MAELSAEYESHLAYTRARAEAEARGTSQEHPFSRRVHSLTSPLQTRPSWRTS
jgi:hypothetical protein